MNSIELKSQRAALVAEARQIIDKAETEVRDLNDEERKAWDSKMSDVDHLANEIAKHERKEKVEHVEAELRQSSGRKSSPFQPTNNRVTEQDRKESFRQWCLYGTEENDNSSDASVRAANCGINLRSNRLNSRALSVGSQGTDLVPVTLTKQIDVALKYYSDLRKYCRVLSTATGNSFEYPTVTDVANSATVKAEAANAAINVDATFSAVTLKSQLYHSGIVQVSVELLQDSIVDIEALLLGDLLPKRLARKEETDFVNGTGGGSVPNGIINAATASVALASGNAITFAKLKALEHSLDIAYRSNARFVMHDLTWAAIEEISDSTGRPIFLPGYQGLSDPSRRTIFGYPVEISNTFPHYSGNEGTTQPMIVFGDFNEFVIRDVATSFELVRLNELYALSRQVGFQLYHRAWSEFVGPTSAMVSLTSI